MNNVILILGMHRSGTSVLTRAVNLLGAALPKSILGKNSSNLRGHWESEVMIVAHDDLLSDSGSDWKDWRRLGWDKAGARKSALMSEVFSETFASEYDEGESVSVVKEPRICRFAASYISTLEKLSAQIHSVIVVRNPLEIANSLQQRDDMQKLDALYLWLTHMLEAELATRGRSRSFVSYESLLKAPDKICANLLSEMPFDLPYEIEEVRKQITEYVSPSLKRQSLAAEDVVLDPIARGWVSDCFEAFMVLAENPTSAAALRKLDDVRAAYFPVLTPLYRLIEFERQRLSEEFGAEICEKQRVQDEAFAAIKLEQEKTWRERDNSYQEKWDIRDTEHANTIKAYTRDHEAAWKGREAEHENLMSALRKENDEVIKALKKDYETQLAATLKEVQQDHESAWKKRETEHDKLISGLSQGHDDAIEALKKKYEDQLALALKGSQQDHEIAMKKRGSEHAKALASLSKGHESAWKKREAEHEQLMSALKQENEQAVKTLQKDYDDQLAETLMEVQQDHEAAWKERDAEHAKEVLSLRQESDAAIESLKNNYSHELHERDKAHVEAINLRDTKIQDLELSHAATIERMNNDVSFMRDEFGSILGAAEMKSNRLSAEREQLRGEIEQVLNSTSWKMTAVLRRVINKIKGVKPETSSHISGPEAPRRLEFKPED